MLFGIAVPAIKILPFIASSGLYVKNAWRHIRLTPTYCVLSAVAAAVVGRDCAGVLVRPR